MSNEVKTLAFDIQTEISKSRGRKVFAVPRTAQAEQEPSPLATFSV